MTEVRRPTKARVRDYMDNRTHSPEPPPTPEEIRRELDWFLLPGNRQPDRGDD